MSDLDPNALATHGGSGGVGFLLAILWQRVFGTKPAVGKDRLGIVEERLKAIEDHKDQLRRLTSKVDGLEEWARSKGRKAP